MITKADKEFIRIKLLPWSGVKGVRVAYSRSTAKWPDIWLSFEAGLPKITITNEWRKQSAAERRKRLVHEFLHLKGLNHPDKGDIKVGKYVYSTFPDKDSYSKAVYRRLK